MPNLKNIAKNSSIKDRVEGIRTSRSKRKPKPIPVRKLPDIDKLTPVELYFLHGCVEVRLKGVKI